MADAIVPLKRPWERMDGETEKAYAVFCQFLRLPKTKIRTQSGVPKRKLQDLVTVTKLSLSRLSKWHSPRGWNWDERAKAYDDYLALCPMDTADIEDRRHFADEMRRQARRFMRLAETNLDLAIYIEPDEAVKLYKLGMDVMKRADEIAKPASANNREQLKGAISGILDQLAASRVGGSAGRGSGANLTATERTIRLSVNDGGGDAEVLEVCGLPGEVRQGDSESDVVGEAD